MPPPEAKTRRGNPPYYDVFGKRYYVLSSSVAYVERGVASWYGPGFHKVKTSSGEIYDMYGMTAAHKTLPLPAVVQVTNLQNGRSVVVRVNDRGPFVGNRIIDLSYTAASKLDMLRDGTAMVEVRSLERGEPPATTLALANPAPSNPAAAVSGPAGGSLTAGTEPAATPQPAAAATRPISSAPAGEATISGKPPLFVQAGAFSDPLNAQRLAGKLRRGSYGKIAVRDDIIAGRRLYRVRIGPVADVKSFDRIVASLERDGVHDGHLALD